MYYVIVQSLKNRLLITANFYHLQGLWLKGCLKMHFLQVECKSSSRSGADPGRQLKGKPNYVMGVWGRRPQRGPEAKPLVRGQGDFGQGDFVPLKLITFSYFRD